MYSLIEYRDNYSKTSGRYGSTTDEQNNNLPNSESFKSKVKITRNTPPVVIQKTLKYFYH